MRQLIIARKDLNMSAGKLAAQCCHAALAFITSPMRDSKGTYLVPLIKKGLNVNNWTYMQDKQDIYVYPLALNKETYEQWICGVFTKTICEAKNRNQLMKAISIANNLGLKEGKDYFLIKDCCLTELAPEEIDENGVGRTLTCIGFRPLPDEIAHTISKKFQLYK